jgi:hypothetical protein
MESRHKYVMSGQCILYFFDQLFVARRARPLRTRVRTSCRTRVSVTSEPGRRRVCVARRKTAYWSVALSVFRLALNVLAVSTQSSTGAHPQTLLGLFGTRGRARPSPTLACAPVASSADHVYLCTLSDQLVPRSR